MHWNANGRNGIFNLVITCFFVIPFQIRSQYLLDKKISDIELLLKDSLTCKEAKNILKKDDKKDI